MKGIPDDAKFFFAELVAYGLNATSRIGSSTLVTLCTRDDGITDLNSIMSWATTVSLSQFGFLQSSGENSLHLLKE